MSKYSSSLVLLFKTIIYDYQCTEKACLLICKFLAYHQMAGIETIYITLTYVNVFVINTHPCTLLTMIS